MSRLIQSKLTDTFGAFKITSNSSKDTSHDVNQKSKQQVDSQIDLYASRRSNLKSPPSIPSSKRSVLLAAVAEETRELLPGVLKMTPSTPPTGELLRPDTLVPALRSACPGLRSKTRIRVVNMDTLDAALDISCTTTSLLPGSSAPPVLVLNMANARYAGGGWLKGAIAQEEALCYRSSLSFSLKLRFYPMSDRAAIYSPTVVVIRESLAKGHRLLDLGKPEELPVVSVVSMAAVKDPSIERRLNDGEETYRNSADRELMRSKIRMILRVAVAKGHRKLVLGALGCGAFGNPRCEVVKLWKDVFAEPEFSNGWWEDVVFAILDNGGCQDLDTNYGVFWRELEGLEI
ncbi:MAG: hypothetical protein Q9220_001232 [cf. Caloplaca sp. 1 TL-2023]